MTAFMELEICCMPMYDSRCEGVVRIMFEKMEEDEEPESKTTWQDINFISQL